MEILGASQMSERTAHVVNPEDGDSDLIKRLTQKSETLFYLTLVTLLDLFRIVDEQDSYYFIPLHVRCGNFSSLCVSCSFCCRSEMQPLANHSLRTEADLLHDETWSDFRSLNIHMHFSSPPNQLVLFQNDSTLHPIELLFTVRCMLRYQLEGWMRKRKLRNGVLCNCHLLCRSHCFFSRFLLHLVLDNSSNGNQTILSVSFSFRGALDSQTSLC